MFNAQKILQVFVFILVSLFGILFSQKPVLADYYDSSCQRAISDYEQAVRDRDSARDIFSIYHDGKLVMMYFTQIQNCLEKYDNAAYQNPTGCPKALKYHEQAFNAPENIGRESYLSLQSYCYQHGYK